MLWMEKSNFFLFLQPVESPGLRVLEVEGMRENMASAVLSEDDWPLPPRTHLTVEAAYTRLSHDAVELGLLWVLTAQVANLGFSIVRDESRLLWGDRATPLQGEREREVMGEN